MAEEQERYVVARDNPHYPAVEIRDTPDEALRLAQEWSDEPEFSWAGYQIVIARVISIIHIPGEISIDRTIPAVEPL
jgi:hypothetical protein